MPELNSELREIYLQPGELHIAREPAIIRKTLGACIGMGSGARSFEWARLLTRCCLVARGI